MAHTDISNSWCERVERKEEATGGPEAKLSRNQSNWISSACGDSKQINFPPTARPEPIKLNIWLQVYSLHRRFEPKYCPIVEARHHGFPRSWLSVKIHEKTVNHQVSAWSGYWRWNVTFAWSPSTRFFLSDHISGDQYLTALIKFLHYLFLTCTTPLSTAFNNKSVVPSFGGLKPWLSATSSKIRFVVWY